MERPSIVAEKFSLFQYDKGLSPLADWGATTTTGAAGADVVGAVDGVGAVDVAGAVGAAGAIDLAGAVDGAGIGAGADFGVETFGVWGARPGITSFSGWV